MRVKRVTLQSKTKRVVSAVATAAKGRDGSGAKRTNNKLGSEKRSSVGTENRDLHTDEISAFAVLHYVQSHGSFNEREFRKQAWANFQERNLTRQLKCVHCLKQLTREELHQINQENAKIKELSAT